MCADRVLEVRVRSFWVFCGKNALPLAEKVEGLS